MILDDKWLFPYQLFLLISNYPSMKLNVPLVRQEKNSEDCGIVCLSMVLKFYNIQKSLTELRQEVKVYPWVWIFMPQLWCYLLKNWFDVEIITLNPHMFTCYHQRQSQKQIKEHIWMLLKQTKDSHAKTSFEYFLEFINTWWKLTADIPSKEDIQEEISQNRPVIALMTSRFLTSSTPWFNAHFNVITWIDDKYMYINDPMPKTFGWKKKYPTETYMYAIHASAHTDIDSASIMKIRKQR